MYFFLFIHIINKQFHKLKKLQIMNVNFLLLLEKDTQIGILFQNRLCNNNIFYFFFFTLTFLFDLFDFLDL